MELDRLSPEDAREIRDAAAQVERTPRILCWNCKKLTPFHEERCEFCGARFAGSTGGVYSTRRITVASVPSVPSDDEELAAARRSLLQLFEDLQRVHDISSEHRYDPVREAETITIFQCPSCGRFVSQEADACACGVRFAPEPPRQDVREEPSEIAYACPLCGAEVTADAVRCACGARFEA